MILGNIQPVSAIVLSPFYRQKKTSLVACLRLYIKWVWENFEELCQACANNGALCSTPVWVIDFQGCFCQRTLSILTNSYYSIVGMLPRIPACKTDEQEFWSNIKPKKILWECSKALQGPLWRPWNQMMWWALPALSHIFHPFISWYS